MELTKEIKNFVSRLAIDSQDVIAVNPNGITHHIAGTIIAFENESTGDLDYGYEFYLDNDMDESYDNIYSILHAIDQKDNK